MKLLLLSDLHITDHGETIIGLDPARRLAETLAAMVRDHADADRLILLGDLTHRGSPAQYDRLKSLLAEVPWPITILPGNHDRRAPLRAAFPAAPVTSEGHLQSVLDTPRHRLITLDTLDEAAADKHSGHLCDARLAWLDAALETDRPMVVFAHHHPVPAGFDGIDGIALRNGPALLSRLGAARARLLICGHIHRSITLTGDHPPVAVLKSTCHQMPLALGPGSSALSVDEPAAYGLLLLHKAGEVLHAQDILPQPAAIAEDGHSHTDTP